MKANTLCDRPRQTGDWERQNNSSPPCTRNFKPCLGEDEGRAESQNLLATENWLATVITELLLRYHSTFIKQFITNLLNIRAFWRLSEMAFKLLFKSVRAPSTEDSFLRQQRLASRACAWLYCSSLPKGISPLDHGAGKRVSTLDKEALNSN